MRSILFDAETFLPDGLTDDTSATVLFVSNLLCTVLTLGICDTELLPLELDDTFPENFRSDLRTCMTDSKMKCPQQYKIQHSFDLTLNILKNVLRRFWKF